MPIPPMPTRVSCPKCGNQFIVPLRTVLDVGEEPELKEQLLHGEVNYARCDKCGTGGMLSSPLVYHDPSKELLITLVPAELGMSAAEQEQFVGSLVNAVMNSVPAEHRKGYFFRPKAALTLDSLFDMILEADGISKEMLDRQRQMLKTLNALLSSLDDTKTLDKLIEEHRAEIDYDFLLLLSNVIDGQREESPEAAEKIEALRDRLLERIDIRMPHAVSENATYDELIEVLRSASKAESWRTTVALNRQRLDYGFFQTLTARIEAAEAAGDKATAGALTDLRKRVLDELDALEKLVRQAEDRASLLIMQLSEAQDLQAAVNEHLGEVNEVFLSLLSRYRAAAEAHGDTARAEKLAAILEAALTALEDRLPPDVRLINRLLRAPFPEGTSAVLEQNRGVLTDEFLQEYDAQVAELEQSGHSDLADHLKQVRGQIVAKKTILRA
ncbi:MAG: CpXC domain-containing protein [Anaerolineae bacterium]